MRRLFLCLISTLVAFAASLNATHACDMIPYDEYDNELKYTQNAKSIYAKKAKMLSTADKAGHFLFSRDKNLKSLDPNAFWLMNIMMQTMTQISTADDSWAWMLLMNDSVKKYNSKLRRKIGSVDAAITAVDELIDEYNSGNQSELNAASYVNFVLTHYKTLYTYHKLINRIISVP